MKRLARDLPAYVAMRHKTHIIFDFDATLLLLDLPWSEWGDTMRDDMQALDTELWNLWENERKLAGVQNAYVAAFGDKAWRRIVQYNAEFERRLRSIQPNEELVAVVRELAKQHHLLIWSSNIRRTIQEALGEQGLWGLFEKVVTREDVYYIKPDPEGFAPLRDTRVPKSRYLMVGDSTSDRGAAHAAGIDFYHTDFFNQNV